ncbi:hypothetical protein [Rossellomorea aquimaris]|nr:hypothetical protein [Rossellomorea aquimaris]
MLIHSYLAKTIAASLMFIHPVDQEAVELQNMIKDNEGLSCSKM